VVGDIHDLIAAIGACRRRGYAIQSAEQSVFNALMILRFVRDDPMTSAVQFDQTTDAGGENSTPRILRLSYRGVNKIGLIRGGYLK
jgi:hypothetical protein